MNYITPYIFFTITFIICLFIIGNKNFFNTIHQEKYKTVVTMSLIISLIVFIMCLSDYYFQK